jgi:hypothetical protein
LGNLSAAKYFEVTLEQAEEAILAKTEGGIMFIPPEWLYHPRAIVPETEFSESSFTYEGVPRKKGMEAIKRLWATLKALSKT